MTMSTQTLHEAALRLSTVLIDTVHLYTAGAPVTVGINVTIPLTRVGTSLPAMVQSTVLQNAVESTSVSTYAIKMARGTALTVGMVVEVATCEAEPALVGKKLLLDMVSLNGLAMLRKAVASDYDTVNQQGKGAL